MLVGCDKKWCKNLIWSMFYGYCCDKKGIILEKGRCTCYEKITSDEMKEKRKRYGYKNIFR